MKMFASLPSAADEGHYYTFLELCEMDHNVLPTGDTGMPSAVQSDLQSCEHCPAFTFLSKSEKERHLKVFHASKPRRRPQQKRCNE